MYGRMKWGGGDFFWGGGVREGTQLIRVTKPCVFIVYGNQLPAWFFFNLVFYLIMLFEIFQCFYYYVKFLTRKTYEKDMIIM